MNAFWVRHLDRTFTTLPTSFYRYQLPTWTLFMTYLWMDMPQALHLLPIAFQTAFTNLESHLLLTDLGTIMTILAEHRQDTID